MAREWSQQQKAVIAWFAQDQAYLEEHGIFIDVNGNLVVRARAGTGKSTTIEGGIKVAPEKRQLVAAFTKVIQLSFDARMKKAAVLEGKSYGHIRVQTLHSVGLGVVKRFRPNLHIDFSSTRADAITTAVCGTRVPDTIMQLVSKLHTKGREIVPHAKNPGDLIDTAVRFECIPDDEWANSGFPLEHVEELALQAMEFAANIKNGDTIDGSDMIFLPIRNGWLTPQFDLVVVDEAQDMTAAQLEIAQGVLAPGGRMAIVGDDRQAIFGWRGADTDAIDRMKRELNAGELGITKTFRCGKVIVQKVQPIVPDFEADENNPEGEIVEIHPSGIVDGAQAGDFILSRMNAPLAPIAMKLLRAGKRTQIAGRNIGKGLISLVRKLRARSIPDFLNRVAVWEEKQIARLQGMLDVAEEKRKNSIKAKMDDIRDQAEMLLFFADGATSVDGVVRNIEYLFEKKEDTVAEDGFITCSSIHRAKGLEAKRVFVLQDTLRDWNEEEMNLQYVAFTRAINTLVLATEHLED